MPAQVPIPALDVKEVEGRLYRRKTVNNPCTRLPKRWGEGCRVLLVLTRYGREIATLKGGKRRVRIPPASSDLRLELNIRGVKGTVHAIAMAEKTCRGYGQSPMAWIPTAWGDGCRVVAVLLQWGVPIGSFTRNLRGSSMAEPLKDVYRRLTSEGGVTIEALVTGVVATTVRDDAHRLRFAIAVTDGTGPALVHLDYEVLMHALSDLRERDPGVPAEDVTLQALLCSKLVRVSGHARIGYRGLEIEAEKLDVRGAKPEVRATVKTS